MSFGRKEQDKNTHRRMNAAQKRKVMLLACLVFLCAAFVTGIFYSSVYRYVHRMKSGQIEQNIWIQGVDVSGLTKGQALKKLDAEWEKVEKTRLIMKDGEKEAVVTVKELGIEQGDMEALVEKARKYAKHGGLFQRYRKIRAAKKEKIEYTEEYRYDEEEIKQILEKKTADMYRPSEDARITRVGGVFQIVDEQAGEVLDSEAAFQKLEEKLPELLKGKESTIEVKGKADGPKITKKDLDAVKDELGSVAIKAENQEEKQVLLTAAGLLNGNVVMPDQELSLKKVLKDYMETFDKEKGLPEAFSQTAAALYGAALLAELDITERNQLDAEAAYAEPGFDAALDAEKNLKIKNNTEAPLYIEAYVDKESNIVCRIYGKDTREKGREVSYESEIIEKKEPETVYAADEELEAGKIETETQGSAQIKAKLWKIVKKGEKRISREEISRTEYKGADTEIRVGTKTDDEKLVEKLEKAVETQDKKTIEDAVKEAKEKKAA